MSSRIRRARFVANSALKSCTSHTRDLTSTTHRTSHRGGSTTHGTSHREGSTTHGTSHVFWFRHKTTHGTSHRLRMERRSGTKSHTGYQIGTRSRTGLRIKPHTGPHIDLITDQITHRISNSRALTLW